MPLDKLNRGKNTRMNAAHSGQSKTSKAAPLPRRFSSRALVPREQSTPSKSDRRRASSPRRPSEAGKGKGKWLETVSYAAENVVDDQSSLRKALPRMRSPQVQRDEIQGQRMPEEIAAPDVAGPGDVAPAGGWRRRSGSAIGARRTSELEQMPKQPADPQLSEEEQLKLDALEMQLPRMAGSVDPVLLVVVLILLCIGLVMVYSASSFSAAKDFGDPAYYFQKQLLGAVLGVVVMFVTMRVDYRIWRRFSLLGLVVGLPLLALVLVVGSNAYGATRWLDLGFFSFQPSELIKLILALYIADWLARKGNKVSTFLYGLTPFVILVGLILGLVLLQNDMGTAIVIAVLATAMFFTAGANILQFLLALGCGILVFLTQAFKGYRYYRWVGFLNPFQHTTDINLQLYQSLLALGSGGWIGVGLGASRQKTGYLPFPFIDSIFAIIGEEIGFLGCMVIVTLFVVLAFRGFRLARRTQDMYGALLATGITSWLVVQAMINIGATTGSIPYTGVPLPFISFGGTSLVISLAAVGVLLNISRYIQVPDDPVFSRETFTKTIRRRKAAT